jgi:hypothetical protein
VHRDEVAAECHGGEERPADPRCEARPLGRSARLVRGHDRAADGERDARQLNRARPFAGREPERNRQERAGRRDRRDEADHACGHAPVERDQTERPE